MSKLYALTILLVSLIACTGQKPYDEHADARAVIAKVITEAKLAKLPIVVIFGANWCPDCRGLSDAIDHGKDALKIAKEFKIIKIDVGNFDTNLDVAKIYGNPIAGGIPGAAILSFEGNLIYVTKPGELASVRSQSDESLYNFLKEVTIH